MGRCENCGKPAQASLCSSCLKQLERLSTIAKNMNSNSPKNRKIKSVRGMKYKYILNYFIIAFITLDDDDEYDLRSGINCRCFYCNLEGTYLSLGNLEV